MNWINIKEKLPENEDMILVLNHHPDGTIYYFGCVEFASYDIKRKVLQNILFLFQRLLL